MASKRKKASKKRRSRSSRRSSRYGHAFTRRKPTKILIYEGGPRNPWWMEVYDQNGGLMSGKTGYATRHAHHEFPHGHTEREYVEPCLSG